MQMVGSDGDKANVREAAARLGLSSDSVQCAFFSAVNMIGSDGDRKAANQTLDPSQRYKLMMLCESFRFSLSYRR
jgi:hypothetical protein